MELDSAAAKMIFVVGNSRSGTTMLGRILGGNAAVHTFGELHYFEGLVDAATLRSNRVWPHERAMQVLETLLTRARDGFFAPVIIGRHAADAAEIAELARDRTPLALYEAFLHTETVRHGGMIACEQTPRYLFFAPEILEFLPNAKIIHVVRDPRDVLISQRNKWRRRFLGASNIPPSEALRSWANYHPALMAKLWVSCIRQGQRISAHPRVFTLRFEDLLEYPEQYVKKICAFSGLDYSPRMLAVPQVGSSSGNDHPEQVGIRPDRANGWRIAGLSRHDIALCEWIAGYEMQSMGYPLTGDGRFSVRFLPALATLGVKLSLAVPMNLSRTKNLRETLLRRFGSQRAVS